MAKAAKQSPPAKRPTTANIHLPPDLLELIHRVAFARKMRMGGRASVSAVIAALIERHRAELEKEAKS